ncbi:MAG: Arylsulfate sulfotransferase-related protein [Methylocystaceae bacterium]|nr:MAG: Arylsulfate sulfotransferase-related [Methylocystaceae bacterium]TXT46287.1 MAG: Arylsulfate sulfotransferase-related protein [Methylocystaceae bacterium]
MSEAEGPQDASSRLVVKHSVVIAGHRTSVSLEDAFWRALKDIAAQDGVSLAGLIARVDAGRGEANLSSSLRVFVLERALDARATSPSPSPHLSP